LDDQKNQTIHSLFFSNSMTIAIFQLLFYQSESHII